MSDLNRKIYAIQDDLSMLKTALNTIKNTQENILITNCISKLKIGKKKLHITFDTALYNDDKNVLIVVRDSSKVTQEAFKETLDNNNIQCNEINFREYLHFRQPEVDKELFFASNIKSLKYALEDSMKKNNEECTYYPAATGHFTLKYFFNKEKQEELDDYYIKGVVEFDDKFIFIINGKREDDLYYKKVVRELEKKKINVSLDYSKEIEESTRKKIYVKKDRDMYV